MDVFNTLQQIDDSNPIEYAACLDCGWKGNPSECETYEDDDGWESGNVYTISVCPVCKKENVVYVRKLDIQ